MAKGRAEIEITASSSRLAAGLNAARVKVQAWAVSTARTAAHAFASVGRGIAKLAPRAGGSLANFGGDMLTKGFDHLAGVADDVRKFEGNLTRLGIATGQTPEQLDDMRVAMRALSKETGVGSDQILAATSNYVDLTGDVQGANTAMRTFARVSQASGASMSDVSGAAAAMGDALKIKPEDLEETFGGLVNQGKAGAVTLKDFAAELSALAPKFARFKGATGREGALQLGAAFQVARKGFGSASEAATGLEALMGALALNAGKFEAAGVKIFERHKDGTKTFRNLHDIIKGIGNSKLAKDPTLLNKAFGSKEAEGAFNQLNRLAPLYDQIVEAGMHRGVIEKDLATWQQSNAGKLEATLNALKETIAEAFTPERIEAFVDAVKEAADAIGVVIDGLGDIKDHLTGKSIAKSNPFEKRGGWLDPDNTGQLLVQGPATLLDDRHNINKALGAGASTAAPAAWRDANTNTVANEAEFRRANSASFASTMSEIEAGKTKAKRTRTAVMASMQVDPRLAGPGATGTQIAGKDWLEAEKIAPAEIERIKAEINEQNAMLKTQIDALGERIAGAVREGLAGAPAPKVQLGDNQVGRSVKKSTDARGGG